MSADQGQSDTARVLRRWMGRWGLSLRSKADGPERPFEALVFALASLFVGAKRFRRRFWTAIGRTIYHPAESPVDWSDPGDLAILAHECAHCVDRARHPIWFPLSYILFLPVLRTMRARWEYRAFGIQMGVWASMTGGVPDRIVEDVATMLSGRDYAWADPPEGRARRRAEALRDAAVRGEIAGLDPADQPFDEILSRAA